MNKKVIKYILKFNNSFLQVTVTMFVFGKASYTICLSICLIRLCQSFNYLFITFSLTCTEQLSKTTCILLNICLFYKIIFYVPEALVWNILERTIPVFLQQLYFKVKIKINQDVLLIVQFLFKWIIIIIKIKCLFHLIICKLNKYAYKFINMKWIILKIFAKNPPIKTIINNIQNCVCLLWTTKKREKKESQSDDNSGLQLLEVFWLFIWFVACVCVFYFAICIRILFNFLKVYIILHINNV